MSRLNGPKNGKQNDTLHSECSNPYFGAGLLNPCMLLSALISATRVAEFQLGGDQWGHQLALWTPWYYHCEPPKMTKTSRTFHTWMFSTPKCSILKIGYKTTGQFAKRKLPTIPELKHQDSHYDLPWETHGFGLAPLGALQPRHGRGLPSRARPSSSRTSSPSVSSNG